MHVHHANVNTLRELVPIITGHVDPPINNPTQSWILNGLSNLLFKALLNTESRSIFRRILNRLDTTLSNTCINNASIVLSTVTNAERTTLNDAFGFDNYFDAENQERLINIFMHSNGFVNNYDFGLNAVEIQTPIARLIQGVGRTNRINIPSANNGNDGNGADNGNLNGAVPPQPPTNGTQAPTGIISYKN